MKPRSLTSVHPAQREDIADLVTYRALPTAQVEMVDPFLFLNHHGRQVYPAPNRGLPFGPHPHRGFETVTFILEGDIMHRDSGGHESVIGPGGIQWMTAGSGLVHSETSSPAFLKAGGPMEILQLWVNLPSKLKMTKPNYVGLQGNEIPVAEDDEGRVRVHLSSGSFDGVQGAVKPLLDITLAIVEMESTGTFTAPVPAGHNIFFYLISGALEAGGRAIPARHLLEFADDGDGIAVRCTENAKILFGHAAPIGEPVVSYGPFVMNTQQEIREAISDYQAGKFGGGL